MHTFKYYQTPLRTIKSILTKKVNIATEDLELTMRILFMLFPEMYGHSEKYIGLT